MTEIISDKTCVELRLVDRATLRRQLFEYIEIDYNRTRRHSALGYISPDAFEAQIAA